MARAIAGEITLFVDGQPKTLRMDIGTMMDLEDHFDMGLVPFLNERLPEVRLGDLACLYLAMTGGDFRDQAAQKEAAQDLVAADLAVAASKIADCLKETLSPDHDSKQKAAKKKR